MAIPRIEGARRVEWTSATLVQLGGSVALVLGALALVWFSFSNWRFKENLLQGYQDYDRGEPKSAKQALESALSWRPRHTGARELLAKILCDEGKLDEARKQYLSLEALGFAGPEIHIGLGVIGLKEAQEETNPKATEPRIAEAEGEFRKAGDVPEAKIGLGQCELLRAWKLADAAHEAKAQAEFLKLRTQMGQSKEFRAAITRDGVIDYYAGLGKALSFDEKNDEAALEAFRAWFQYTGSSWGLPLADILALESRRLARYSGGADGLLKFAPELNSLRNQAGAFWRNTRHSGDQEGVREPWLMYCLVVARAWGRGGNVNEMTAIIHDLESSAGLEQRMEPPVLDAEIRTELALRDDGSASAQEAAVARANVGYTELLGKIPSDDAHKELRGRAINNSAWGLAWRGGYANNETLVMQAHQRLEEALRLFPDDYVYNRNMAVVLKRLRRPPTSPQPYLDRCRAASKTPEQASDFEKVEKYMEGK